jgi:hypothetical protein
LDDEVAEEDDEDEDDEEADEEDEDEVGSGKFAASLLVLAAGVVSPFVLPCGVGLLKAF